MCAAHTFICMGEGVGFVWSVSSITATDILADREGIQYCLMSCSNIFLSCGGGSAHVSLKIDSIDIHIIRIDK